MTIEDIQKICKKLKAVTTDIKWENHLCFNIGGKMFLITAPDSFPVTASFKADDEEFEELCAREGIIPAPYLARYKWVHLDNINRLSAKEWEHYIGKAYHLIASKLPAKMKKEIGLK